RDAEPDESSFSEFVGSQGFPAFSVLDTHTVSYPQHRRERTRALPLLVDGYSWHSKWVKLRQA
ncbi:hypothetical protein ABFP36_23485, partial [Salmonella enterica subsp. enterica serovar Kentucky]|uniref:hypothetical protein n=1 Tax=Salmonella enterica TaxID=28901 RepID=UPI003F4C015D